jgi:hypothetical protein
MLCPIHHCGMCALSVGLQSAMWVAYANLSDAGGGKRMTRSTATGTTTTMPMTRFSPARTRGPSASDPVAAWPWCSGTSSITSVCPCSMLTVNESDICCLLHVQVCERVWLPELPQLPGLQRADLRRGLGVGFRHVAAQAWTLSNANALCIGPSLEFLLLLSWHSDILAHQHSALATRIGNPAWTVA